jgi:ATP-binding cassette subfamily B multidrug efflux pump
MASPKSSLFDFQLLQRIVGLTKPYRLVYYASMALSVLLAITSIGRPFLIIYATDHYITGGNFDLEGLKFIAILMLILLLVDAGFRYTFNYITAWLGQSIVKDVRVKVYEHIINARLQYFDNTPIGTSTTRTITDIEAINDTFSEGLISIIADLLTIITVIIAMFYVNWKVALASLMVLPLLLWFTRWFQEGVKKSFQDERFHIGRLNAFLQEHISGMRIIQIFNVEEKERKKFEAINTELRDANVRGIWYYSLFFPAVEVCLAIAVG